MAHIDKAKAVGVAAVLEHNARTDSTRPHNHSNEDIDPTRTKDNYELHEPLRSFQRQGKNAYALLKKRLDEVHCMKRDDVTVMSLLCVTLPKNVRPEDERSFFEGVYAWACEEYGAENIVNATVHKDETTPHIHIGFVPVVEGTKRNGEPCLKVRHSALITRTYLDTFHERLSAAMKQFLGYEVAILNGATANGAKTVAELKAERANERADRAEERAAAAEERAKTAETSLVSLLGEIPPKPQPPTPPPDKPPKGASFTEKRAYRQAQSAYKSDLKQYEKALSEWESKYLTADNLAKAQGMVEQHRAEVEPTLEHARNLEAAAAEHERSAKGKLKEIEKFKENLEKQVDERVQQTAQQLVQQHEDRLFGKDGKSRTERLERFCDDILLEERGQTVLGAFEEQEAERKEQYRGFGR